MEVNIKVTLSADAELLTHLATLTECMQQVLHVSNSQLVEVPIPEEGKEEKLAAKPAKPSRSKAKKEEPAEPVTAPAAVPVSEEKEPEPAPANTTPEEETVTLAEARKICADIVRADKTKTAGLKAAIQACGGEKLTDIPVDKLPELVKRVQAL